MALVTVEDVQARLGRALTSDEQARFTVVSGDVEAHLRVVAPRIPHATTPPAVVRVASELVISALATPPGTTADVAGEALGGYSVTYRQPTASGLTELHEQLLSPWLRPRAGTQVCS